MRAPRPPPRAGWNGWRRCRCWMSKANWADEKPEVRPGGWAFQYRNDHYPDLDDTAVVVMAMDRAAKAGVAPEYKEAIARGAEWVDGLQSRNGGWGLSTPTIPISI